MHKTLLALALAAVVAGCAVTQPAPPVSDLPPPTATAADNAQLERWWVAFDDPALTTLVEEALANNLDLQRALTRVELARAAIITADANLYPTVDLGARAARSKITGVTNPPLPDGTPLIASDYRIGFDLSYQLDIWGKYRSGALAAQNDLVAARYYREVVRITVAGDTASAYFRLRAADAELQLLQDTLVSRQDTVRLQRDRYDAGLIGEYDMKQAEAEVSSVVGNIARAKDAISQLESAIAMLAGRSPRAVFTPEVSRGRPIDLATSVPLLPSGLPSGVLERRPDIRRSEALLAASDLRIQEARADYFPAITLTGAYGTESAVFSKLFSGPAGLWSLGAGLLQPIIGIARIDAQVDAATARRNGALVDYRQTVQGAFREVHDALVTNQASRDVLAAETARREQLAAALAVATLRYEAGRTSYLEVLDAQRTLLLSDTLRIGAARDARLSIVNFAKSLGGGWDPVTFAASR
jgi:multidrug efflux system outer membrane protein